MAWILQGNPSRFDIDDYLTRYPFVYWSAPVLQREFQIGDLVFLWRSGRDAGVVAIGRVAELPTSRDAVKHSEALGDDLWTAGEDAPSAIKVGLRIEEVRLTANEGMVSRQTLLVNPILSGSQIIRVAQGTVFRLTAPEAEAILELWGSLGSVGPDQEVVDTEGRVRLRQHYVRERSRRIIDQKKQSFLQQHNGLLCEVCGFNFAKSYPVTLGKDFIEVHHLTPLSSSNTEKKTTLEDLLLVCSNCHRMIHRTTDCDSNLLLLRRHFAERTAGDINQTG